MHAVVWRRDDEKSPAYTIKLGGQVSCRCVTHTHSHTHHRHATDANTFFWRCLLTFCCCMPVCVCVYEPDSMVHIIEKRDMIFVGVETGELGAYRLSTGAPLGKVQKHKACISCCVVRARFEWINGNE